MDNIEETIKKIIIKLLMEDNSGLLPDEAEKEAEKILYRKDLYETAKYLLLKDPQNFN